MKTIWIEEDYHRVLKKKAVNEDTTMQEVTERIFEKGLIKEKEEREERVNFDTINTNKK